MLPISQSVALYNAPRYGQAVIKRFRDAEAEKVWSGRFSKRLPPDVQRITRRKLRMLNNAQSLDDLRVPPANRLEALTGNRAGQHSIRINQQWRIRFEWRAGHTEAVQVVDCH